MAISELLSDSSGSESLHFSPAHKSTLENDPRRPSSPPFSMAFQPIVDLHANRIFAYEALVRGHGNEPASSVLCPARIDNRISLDSACRLTAIEIASSLGVLETGADLAINVNARPSEDDIPNLPATVAAAERVHIPLNRLILEMTENERLRNPHRLQDVLDDYRQEGLRLAIDDFGAGFAGLSLLAAFRPDILKIDIALTRDVHVRRPSRVIIRSIVQICHDLNITLIAEGCEDPRQAEILHDLGIRYMQGNFFAAPAFEALPTWPRAA